MVVASARVNRNMPKKYPVRIDDLYKFRIPLEPCISPSGKQVVFTLERMVKKDKKYYISTKDIILIESLKSDGVQVLKKYEDLYQIDNFIMPNDIQVLIDNDEIGLVLLRLVEVIGQDEINDIGSETLYFIISALNQLDIDLLRNKILLKVLPLKVQKYK